MRSGSRPKKNHKDRGNLHDFFDPTITEQLRRPKSASAATWKHHVDAKPSLTASLSNGQLQVSQKLLKEECSLEFRDRWFFNTQDHTSSIRETIKVFEVGKILRPSTARAIEPVAAAAGRSPTAAAQSASRSDRSSPKSPPRSRGAAKVSLWDTFDLEPDSKTKTVAVKSKLGESASRPQKKVFEHQVRALGSILNHRKTLLRVRQERPESISADYILFIECLRKNILPHAVGRLSVAGGAPSSPVAGSASDAEPAEAVVNPNLHHIITMKDLEEMGEDLSQSVGSSSTVSFRNNVVSVEHSAVIVLDLSHRGLGPDRGICLSESLSYCPHLTTVKLCNNRFDDFSSVRIVSALFEYSACTSLDLSENTLGPLSINVLSDYLQSADCELQLLNINRCSLTEALSAQIGSSLIQNESLTSLSIADGHVGSQDISLANCWSQVLHDSKTLKHLDLSQNFFKRGPAIQLFASLSVNRSLTSLNLSHNQIADLEATYCALSVEENPVLTSLDLSSNLLGSKGCIALAHCCSAAGCAMRTLDLTGNVISDRAAAFAWQCMADVARRARPSTDTPAGTAPLRGSPIQRAEATQDETQVLHIACIGTTKTDNSLQDYDPFFPGGKFELDLSDPFHRVIAKACLRAADTNLAAKIQTVRWWNPLFNAYEHATLYRRGFPPAPPNPYGAPSSSTRRPSSPPSLPSALPYSTSNESAVEDLVTQVIVLSRNPEAKRLDGNLRAKLRQQIGFYLHDDLVSFLLKELKQFTFTNGMPIQECYTLILYLLYEYLRNHRSIVDVQQLVAHNHVLHVFHSLQTLHAPSKHAVAIHAHKMLSELGLNDLDNTVSKVDFIAVWLERSLQVWGLPNVPEYISHATQEPYVVPLAGKMTVECVLPRVDGLGGRTMHDCGLRALLDSFSSLPKQFADRMTFLNNVLDSREHMLYLSCEQAEHLLVLLDQSNSSIHANFVEKLLFQIRNAPERRRFLIRNLYFHEILQLRKKMGYLFNAIVGCATGHYFLDLSEPYHRKTVHWLWQRFEHERFILRGQNSSFDSSQTGDGGSFRNCTYNGNSVALTWEWCQSMPAVGKLRFDFVSTDRTATVMPMKGLLEELKRVAPGRRVGGGGAVHHRSGLELLMDIVFSPDYIRQLRKVARKQRLPHKNDPTVSIEETKRAIMQGFAAMNAPKEEETEDGMKVVSSDSSEDDLDDDNYHDVGGEDEDDADGESPFMGRGSTAGAMSPVGKQSYHGASMIRLLSQMDKQKSKKGKRRGSAFYLPSATVTAAAEKKRKNQHFNRVHNTYVVHAMDLWVDYSRTSWERYKLAHTELLSAKAEAAYREMLKESGVLQRNETTSKQYPQEVYAQPQFQSAAKQPIHQSVTVTAKRRGGIVKGNIHGSIDALQKPRASGSPHRSTLSAATLSRSSRPADPVAPDEEILESSASCSRFEGMLLNLEICLLYNLWLETSHVKKILEQFVQRHAPVFVLARVVAILFRTIIDLEYLSETVFIVCGAKVHLECMHRFGGLNFCSVKSFGKLELDLASRDHQLVAQAVVGIAQKGRVDISAVSMQPSLIQTATSLEVAAFLSSTLPTKGFLQITAQGNELERSEDGEEDAQLCALTKMFLAGIRPLWK